MYKEGTTTVKIATDTVNCYATIVRSMITATNAAIKLKDNKLALKFQDLKDYANNMYNDALTERITASYSKAVTDNVVKE